MRKNYLNRATNAPKSCLLPYSPFSSPFVASMGQYQGQNGIIPYMVWLKALERAKRDTRDAIRYDALGRVASNTFQLLFFLLSLPSPIAMTELSGIWGSNVTTRMVVLRKLGLVNFTKGHWHGSIYSHLRLKPTYDLACKYYNEAMSIVEYEDELI
jgi:hypothetical protein